MADERTFIRVHDGMPDHPKVEGLSDKAFRALLTEWCWCSRQLTDGKIPAGRWRKQPAKVRRELVSSGLVEELAGGDVQMHDYLEWQRSAAEVAELKAAKSRGGSWGNHVRWHEDRHVRDPGCEHCAIGPPIAPPIGPPIGVQIAKRSESDRKTIASSSSESEEPPSGVLTDDGSVPDLLQLGDVREEDSRSSPVDEALDGPIAAFLHAQTGRSVTLQHAAKVRTIVTAERPDVREPVKYVIAAIRREPDRYLPAAVERPAGRPPWCGACDPETRLIGDDRPRRCPECHPLRGEP